MASTMNLYQLSNYPFGVKEEKVKKETSVAGRIFRIRNNYTKFGMRRSVEGVLVVQENNHPHILLLQVGGNEFKLPGGRLRPGETEVEGLKRKLTSKLGANLPALVPDWNVGEHLFTWWCPSFEPTLYPYCPPHITKPKESKSLFIVHLSERERFAVPKNLELVAVPLFDLYANPQNYGPEISSIPQLLSKFKLNLIS